MLVDGGSDSTPMTRSRAQKLESIGFKWSTKDPRHVPWMTRYQELVDFTVSAMGCAQRVWIHLIDCAFISSVL